MSPQIDADAPNNENLKKAPNENLKKNAEAEYTSKAAPKMAAPNTGSGVPHQHHTQNQNGKSHGENRGDGSHHHHRRDVAGNNIVGNHFKIGRRIGEGSFGIIYDGINTQNNQHVAIKYESKKSEAPQLRDEYRTYKLLQGFTGIPNAYYFGSENMYNILVIDLLGPSLEDLFDTCNRKFSVKTVCLAAKQMLYRVQSVHEKSLVYRDIKPDNFLVGRIPPYVDTSSNNSLSSKDVNSILKNHSKEHPHPASQIYLIDFGMAKFYRDPKTLQHIPYKEKRSLSGTARYMSINTHLGREQSRRDDLEGLGHVLMYFLRGSLPWQGMKAATNKQKYEKIGEKKRTTPIKELCDGFPEEFSIYMNYVRKLGFEETPDYDYLRGLFDTVLKRMGEEEDNVFDWMIELEEQRKEIARVREKQKPSNNNNNSSNNNNNLNQPQKASNLSVPGNGINDSTTQNASMQVLRGGIDSVDEMANTTNSQTIEPMGAHKEPNITSPLNKEIKMEASNEDMNEDENNGELQKSKSEDKMKENGTNEKENVKVDESKNEPTAQEPIHKSIPEIKIEPSPESEPETKKNSPEPTQKPATTNEPVAAAAPAPAATNNNEQKDPPKKKSKRFFLFSCCTSAD